PFLVTKLRGPYGWITFGLVWGLALATLVAKPVLTKRFAKPPVGLCVVMGWFALLVFNQATRYRHFQPGLLVGRGHFLHSGHHIL
ncbi:MAG: hypothetical protein MUQ10_18220, partial [Anaerolineae bacterium]|nr:hypothetical protein [Anaerolineae bacterium]